MINDSHIHVGQFYDTYTSPRDLSSLMKDLGVERYAVSSTTTCEKNFTKVLSEIQSLISIDGRRIVPVLWISPEFFHDNKLIETYINSGIEWGCIKIHPDWQPNIWSDSHNKRNLLDLSKVLNIPILIHTGGHSYSEALVWEDTIKNNPEQKFILAHCRPFQQAFSMIKKYKNVYGDLAFVDTSNFYSLHDSGICNRILWGSDLPIFSYYIEDNIQKHYEDCLKKLEIMVEREEFRQITVDNFNNLFK